MNQNQIAPDREEVKDQQPVQANKGEERQRWAGRTTFILAAIGSAIGLGNFWRFPYLVYKHGGAIFFIPYIIALLVIGIPMLLLELALGQKFQRGDIGVFRGIFPRAAGIGIASVFSACCIVVYYSVILSWSTYYFALSFVSPLKWSNEGYDNKCQTGAASEFFYRQVLKYQGDDCLFVEPGDTNEVSWWLWFCSFFCWVIIYLCVFKGVKSSSYVVWVTVPLPLILIVVLLIRGVTLDGAGRGIDIYLTGEDGTDIGDKLTKSAIWTDAIGQIFFSLSVSMGVMTSYGSYNPRNKPVIADNFIISISNSFISFISGFTVFSIIGYLRESGSPVSNQVASFGLAYIALPTAASEMPGSNFWNLLLFLTLFLLGIDSAFSMVEAICTVLNDTVIGKKLNKMIIAAIICTMGFILSLTFCSDIGYILLDVVDHYTTTYIMISIGILQCLAVGWIYEVKDIKDKVSPISIIIFTCSFWFSIIILPIIGLFSFNSYARTMIIAEIVLLPIMTIISWLFSQENTFKEWFNIVFFCGVRKIARHITLLSNKERKDHQDNCWWEPVFEIWWGFSVKYAMPAALSFGMLSTFRGDLRERYGGYPLGTNFIGWAIAIVGGLCVIVPVFLCTKWEPFGYDVDQPFELMAKEHFTKQEIDRRKKKESEDKEMKDVNTMKKSDTSKVNDQTSRSIVETEHNLKLDEDE